MTVFTDWLDKNLPDSISESVIAFSFNLYETSNGFGIELVGAGTFDLDDPDWACDEVWELEPRGIDLPTDMTGDSWEKCLENMKSNLQDYISNGSKSAVLKSVSGIGIGFVDGDMEVL